MLGRDVRSWNRSMASCHWSSRKARLAIPALLTASARCLGIHDNIELHVDQMVGVGKPAPMTLGNMRANGVHSLAVWCLGRDRDHHCIMDVSNYLDDVAVSSFGLHLRCKQRGHLGADARPNWQERAAVSLFGPPRNLSADS